MSVATVDKFMSEAIADPDFAEKFSQTLAASRSPQEAGETVARLGAERGYEFSAADALAFRESMMVTLEPIFAGRPAHVEGDDILAGVSGGSQVFDPNLVQTGMGTGMPGGMVVGAAAGAAVDSAQNGSNFMETFAHNLNNALNDAKNTVQQVFSFPW